MSSNAKAKIRLLKEGHCSDSTLPKPPRAFLVFTSNSPQIISFRAHEIASLFLRIQKPQRAAAGIRSKLVTRKPRSRECLLHDELN